MKQYIITGALTLSVILLIVATTLLTINTAKVAGISILSIEAMQNKGDELEEVTDNLEKSKKKYEEVSKNLEKSKNAYVEAKDAYSNITDEKIDMIKEATKEEQYQIEWLWIILGEYAEANNLTLDIVDPRKGSEKIGEGTVQIKLVGRYLDISNFVFEVENDNSLMFKLDNMSMQYASNNKVSATFDVLSMGVLF